MMVLNMKKISDNLSKYYRGAEALISAGTRINKRIKCFSMLASPNQQ